VGVSGERWRNLIAFVSVLPAEQAAQLVKRLTAMGSAELSPADRNVIWNALRDLIAQHRSFPEASWALPAERIDPLATVLEKFVPADPISRHGWLFANGIHLPGGRTGDRRMDEEALGRARLDAARAVFSETGWDGLVDLARTVERSDLLGIAIGRSELLEEREDEVFSAHLAGEDVIMTQFTCGLALGRCATRGRDWLEEKLLLAGKTWTPAQRGEFLALAPADERTWNLVENLEAETAHEYWRRASFYGILDSAIYRIARKLIDNGRARTAVDLLAMHPKGELGSDSSLIVDALEALLDSPREEGASIATLSHEISDLLDVLTRRQDTEEERVAKLEWAFLPLLAPFDHRPTVLQRAMAQSPEFFAEVLSLVFRAEDEDRREVSEEDRTRAERGHDLLDSWRTVPGTGCDGTIDTESLQNWVRRARKACAQAGRARIGDQTIGQLLSGSPQGEDGIWPHPSVRVVIEETASSNLELGVEVGLRNRRGFSTRGVFEGGVRERQLADRYSNFAAKLNDTWPRAAAMLRRWADRYSAEALRRDDDAQLRSDLGL